MKLCLIGNSHLVCVKQAIAARDWPLAAGASFVYAPREELEIEIDADGVVSPKAARASTLLPDGAAHIQVEEQDAFIIVGLGFSASKISRLYRDWRLLADARPADRLASRALLKASVIDALLDTRALNAAARLRAASDKPIFAIPSPTPQQRIVSLEPVAETQRMRIFIWAPRCAAASAARLEEIFVEAAAAACARVGATFIPQPPETRAGFFTKDAFREFNRQFFDTSVPVTPNALDDVSHANAAYGAYVLAAIDAALSGQRGRPAAGVNRGRPDRA
jgi:hypothetical protein